MALRQRDQDDIRPHDESIDSHHLQEYLLAEIMNSLDPLLREGLLITAWLDRFCPALCSALCRPDAAAAPDNWTGEVFVRRLREDNLFLISLDSEARWFRLHHLFRDMLRAWGRNQFSEAEIAAIHCRAGAWFARNGLPDEAIRYLVLGGDYDAAEQVVQQHRYALMNSEQWPRLERWLRQFPAEVRETRATLAGADCVLAMHMGQYRMTISLARKAEALLATLPPGSANYNEVLGEVSAITAALALAEGSPEVLMSGAQRAVELLPMDALLLRSLATGVIAGGMQMRGDYEDGR
ncbi:MAG: hypothetical protein KDE24_25060, partial [Caldilinea sp.]|nr:hypothetical protein [Caldilinea sp.]